MSDRSVSRRLAIINRELAKLVDHLIESAPPEETPGVASRFEKAIVEALGSDTMPAKKIARRSGYAYSARLRSTLADLVRRGILTHGPDGYRRAPGDGTSAPKGRASQD